MPEQALTNYQLMNAVNLVATMAVSRIADILNQPPTLALLDFMESETCDMLYDTQTKFWCDGPEAVAMAYLLETNEQGAIN